jgi:hypothetical protein
MASEPVKAVRIVDESTPFGKTFTIEVGGVGPGTPWHWTFADGIAAEMRERWAGAFPVSSSDRPLRIDPPPSRAITFRRFALVGGPGDGIIGETERDLTATHIDVSGERYEPAGLDEWGRQVFAWVAETEVQP